MGLGVFGDESDPDLHVHGISELAQGVFLKKKHQNLGLSHRFVPRMQNQHLEALETHLLSALGLP
jgi:hypothetical protein